MPNGLTRYVRSKNELNLSKILQEAEKFQRRVPNSIKNFEAQYVTNMDQTSREIASIYAEAYHIKEKRQLKEVYLEDFNKVTHGYMAQYALTAAGTLMPQVFLCMQETKGDFGSRVRKTVQALYNGLEAV